MAPKKKVQEETKLPTKSSLPLYIERYNTIGIYLKLLNTPILAKLFPQVGVGTEHLYDQIEVELKKFLEQRFQVLTGLVQEPAATDLSDSERKVLKMMVSKVVGNENTVHSDVVETKTHISNIQPVVLSQVTDEISTPNTFFETETVAVEEIREAPAEKKAFLKRQKNALKEVVKETDIPVIDGPTDRMRRSKPVGVQPLPAPNEAQAAYIASMQAQAGQGLNDQMLGQVSSSMPDSRGSVNFEDFNR